MNILPLLKNTGCCAGLILTPAAAAAFTSGMHASLRVPELLELILTSFSDPKAKDPLNCALVSRYWADIAIPI
jgi:hypothetical protein